MPIPYLTDEELLASLTLDAQLRPVTEGEGLRPVLAEEPERFSPDAEAPEPSSQDDKKRTRPD